MEQQNSFLRKNVETLKLKYQNLAVQMNELTGKSQMSHIPKISHTVYMYAAYMYENPILRGSTKKISIHFGSETKP